MSKLLAALSIVLAVAATVLPASAQDKGPIVLTIAGAIETANRGGVDPFDDVYLDFHDVTFDEAFAFDRTTLSALT